VEDASEEGQIHWDLKDSAGIARNDQRRFPVRVWLSFPLRYGGQSYDVNFLTGIQYMDEMNPNWQMELHEKMSKDPPAIFSTCSAGLMPMGSKRIWGSSTRKLQIGMVIALWRL
jgi:hypothetical protein